jgi:hypothetical protein
MSEGRLLTLVSSGARTANGNGDALEITADALAVTLEVTAASGTSPTLNVFLEDAPTLNGPWTTLATYGQKTGASVEAQRVTNGAFHDYARVRWSIAGTNPSFTFSVRATVR